MSTPTHVISIAGRDFSSEHCLIIGEVAQAHDGSLGMAHAFIDVIAEAGADAVKFQTHLAQAESTLREPWRVKFSRQDETRYDYWKRMEFTEEQWHGLASHARERGLVFLSSPFSTEAVDLLSRVGMPAWKIASGEVNNVPMFERIASHGLPVLLSSGMSSIQEIDAAVQRVQSKELPLVLMQCTTTYPSPAEKIGLNLVTLFRERYGCAVGLSDHSGTIYPSLAAATLGITALEVHVTLSRAMFGPDVSSSVTPSEFKQLVQGVRFIETMRTHPVDKDQVSQNLEPVRRLFTKSIVAKIGLERGTILTDQLITLKKPGAGLGPEKWASVLGRKLRRAMAADEMITEADLES